MMPINLTEAAKELRQNSTDAERMLWQHLRARQLDGLKFRRQEQIGHFIADFVCYEKGIIVEADGGQHAFEKIKDEERTLWLNAQGFRVVQTLERKLGNLLDGKRLNQKIWPQIPADRILMEVEGRIRLTLEKDFKLRHGGILRLPSDLIVQRRYDRPEIINHFGEQYDPARHNFGVITFKKNVVIITKLDTSSAMQAHQYLNSFIDGQTFAWQSQNQQRQDNTAGRLILDHKANGNILHLFVQSRSHEKAYYCGTVTVLDVKDDAPMNVKFRLDHPLSLNVCNDLIG